MASREQTADLRLDAVVNGLVDDGEVRTQHATAALPRRQYAEGNLGP